MPSLRNRLDNIYFIKEHCELYFPPLLTIQIYHVRNLLSSVNPPQKVRHVVSTYLTTTQS
ncbi:hypothetical protein COJ16_17530 [Bacillus cereus]|nr:hypothetical protein COJ16_17530 [Bacillus cereus]